MWKPDQCTVLIHVNLYSDWSFLNMLVLIASKDNKKNQIYIIVLYFISKLSKASVTDFSKADESYTWQKRIMDFIAMKERENLKNSKALIMELIKTGMLLLLRNLYGPLEFWLSSTCHYRRFYWQGYHCSLGSLESQNLRKRRICDLITGGAKQGKKGGKSMNYRITVGNWLLPTVEPSEKLCETCLWTITLGEKGKCI